MIKEIAIVLNYVGDVMAKTKNSEQPCQCHSCSFQVELIQQIAAQTQQMAAQNQLMTKIMDQNSTLIDLIVNEEVEEKDPMRSLD